MTVSSTTSIGGPYNTDGSTVTFTFGFDWFENADIDVQLLDVSTGVIVSGALNSDFSVTLGSGDGNSGTILGGSITVQANAFGGIANGSGQIPVGYTITISRSLSFLQSIAYPEGGAFPSEAAEQGYDRVTVFSQQLLQALSLALQFPVVDGTNLNNVLPPKAQRAGKALSFDASGNIATTAGFGTWRGTWATATAYNVGDIVQDGAAGADTLNYYYCINANTSGTWSSDLATDWIKAVDIQQIVTYTNAAAASATAAASSATSAASSATAAAASALAAAGSLLGTSTSSVLIGTGSKTFTTQSGRAFATGQFILISSTANSANYMLGQVTSYSGTSLVVNVLNVGGSGTFASWNISVSGSQGATGPAGTAYTEVSINSTTTATSGKAYTATGACTLNVPLSTGQTTSFSDLVFAEGGAVTVSCTSPDTINGGSAGGSVTILQGDNSIITTDANGHWYVGGISPITNAMLATMAANTVKANATAGTATPTDVALSASQLLGRGASGNLAAIGLGSGLSMSGTTLNGTVLYNYISGFIPSAFTSSTITFGGGCVTDQFTNYTTNYFSATNWNVANGNNINGYQGGTSLPANSTIHFFACLNSTGGCTGIFASLSLTPTLPSGSSYYRRVFSCNTDGSGNLLGGTAIEIEGGGYVFFAATATLDVSVTNLGTSSVLYPIAVPSLIKVQPLYRTNAFFSPGGDGGVLLTSPDETDVAPAAVNSSSAFSGYFNAAPGIDTGGYVQSAGAHMNDYARDGLIITNTSAQIRARSQGANNSFYWVTRGWKDFRRT